MSYGVVVLFDFKSPNAGTSDGCLTQRRKASSPAASGDSSRAVLGMATGVVVCWRCGSVASRTSGQDLGRVPGSSYHGSGQGGNGMPRSPANGQPWHGGQDWR